MILFFFFFWGGGGWDMMTLWAFFLGGGHRKTGLFWGMSDTSDTFFWSGGMLGPSLRSKKN